ncbi:MAG: aminotransferase class V-fold PLP-dependent enzyme [Fusobacterium sp.]|nr:aminotransferase class V-fold PLP-dependent enzyme [Fusobacterium sp.]
MAYFDNAATTFPKPKEVYDFMDKFYREVGGSVGRTRNKATVSAFELVKNTREKIKKLLHCGENKEIVFTPSATIALNMIIQGLIKEGHKNFYISPFEHNAVLRVLHNYEKDNKIKVTQLVIEENFVYDLEKIRNQFEILKPDVLIINHASNVFGLISPIKEIFNLGKKYSAKTVLDMSQTAGLIDTDTENSKVDYAVFNGHKTLYGPVGIAGFTIEKDEKLPSVLFGGTGYNSANVCMPDALPERYEMGTINILSIAGLSRALDWLSEKNIENIKIKEEENRKKLLAVLNKFSFIKPVLNYEDDEHKYVGIVSCIIEGMTVEEVTNLFDELNIVLRTGLHCSPVAHQIAGTFSTGTLRFSVSYFTTEQDYKDLEEALNHIKEKIE